jgi:hypothetical protein
MIGVVLTDPPLTLTVEFVLVVKIEYPFPVMWVTSPPLTVIMVFAKIADPGSIFEVFFAWQYPSIFF